MKKFKNLVWLLLFGSLWGINEVFLGEVLFEENLPYASVWLTAWALFVLSLARGVLNKPGSSIVIGTFAATFKLVNVAPFFCHLLGIFILGLIFDVVSSLFLKKEGRIFSRSAMTGVVSTYGAYTVFALVMTYIIRYEYWISGGLAKVLSHVFISGSLAALMAVMAAPLGYLMGLKGVRIMEYRPRWTYTGVFVVLVVLWTLGKIAG